MLACEKRWTLHLGDDYKRHLRTIVDLGALAQERCNLSGLLSIHPDHPNVTFDERTVLEVALLVGLKALAKDLERELGTSLDQMDGNDGTNARATGPES